MNKAIVAQFIKESSGRLELWSITAFQVEIGYGGSTYISRRYYDVDTSKKYGYIFHLSGFGGGHRVEVDGIYFATGDVAVREKPSQLCCWPIDETGRRTRAIRKRNRTRRLMSLPKEFDLKPGQDLIDWLEHNAIQQDAVYCSKCQDFFPEDSLCKHCWWCDKNGWWSTPSEPCGHDGGEDCWT